MLRKEGYKVKTASTRSNKALRLIEMLGLIVRYHKTTDIVLIDTYGAMNFYYAYLVAKTCQAYNVDYIPILHGGNLPERLSATKKYSQSLFGKAKINIAPSKFLYDIFKAEGFHNTKIIPNAIQMENYPFKKRENFQPKLLWVRRFQKRYNPVMALEVLLLLKKDYPNAKLCMVGPDKDGTMKTCKKFAVNHGLNIEFPGKLKKKAWAKLSKDYDFFINTTNIDNTPISVIEAMSLGLAVVSTNVGGMPMLINNNSDGVLVPVNDAKTMAAEITKLIEDPGKARTLTENARNKVEDFAWEKVKTDWNRVLNS
ncbi:Glycosyltransferase involved in cell wall bisynthesis [Salegentibacter salegens]|uniref:Glycosyltransferase involved in cell wall bisynthesis n=2 Tax=Salegentibacter salegens TaxID=143223 RepID=A0A1M7NF65_9FLAO|nr:glycosyltransferase involved in cell wall biosynthesis [Salegentibacter salegens]SHN02320.1 Glycosyltransferase involved in cell wall bisynthesis [Salegentibacter salegens]